MQKLIQLHTQPFYSSLDFVQDKPGELVPRYILPTACNANMFDMLDVANKYSIAYFKMKTSQELKT